MRSMLCTALITAWLVLGPSPWAVCGESSPAPPFWPLPPSHCVEYLEDASIDWTSHIVYALGSSEVEAEDDAQATVRAYENARQAILAAIQGMNATSTATVEVQLSRRASALIELQRLASDPRVLAQCVQYGHAPSASALLGLDLRSSHILPLLVEGIGVGELQSGLPKPTPPPPEASAEWLSSIRHPTGLIIDARSVRAEPALCPTIYSEDERLVFDVRHARRIWFMQHGGLLYMSDLDAAKSCSLVGVNPKIVEAVSVSSPNSCDLIVSDDDAERLLFLRERLPFFAECRLIIVCRDVNLRPELKLSDN